MATEREPDEAAREPKDRRLALRMTAANKHILEAAAGMAGVDTSSFVTMAAMREARHLLATSHIALSEADTRWVADQEATPDDPTDVMREAVRGYRETVVSRG